MLELWFRQFVDGAARPAVAVDRSDTTIVTTRVDGVAFDHPIAMFWHSERRLASAAEAYDIVVLDCSPSLSLMNQNALVFADGILVPVACDYLSLVGVRQVIKTVKNVNALLHHPVQIFGVLPTFYDARARICRDAVETLRDHFGDRCLEPIRATIKIKEAPAQGTTIFEYATDSNAAEDYQRVVDRIIDGPSAAQAPTEVAASA